MWGGGVSPGQVSELINCDVKVAHPRAPDHIKEHTTPAALVADRWGHGGRGGGGGGRVRCREGEVNGTGMV